MENSTHRRRFFLVMSIATNLGILGFFKYCNFFLENFSILVNWIFGSNTNIPMLHIILPVGISFYTFQTMSYTIDVYRLKCKPSREILEFATFVSFFPQLVAGPIERAKELLPQFQKERTIRFEDIQVGSWLIFWGLFKKVAVADSLAPFVNRVFEHPEKFSGAEVYYAFIGFTIQIYCDFSGYSLIARGVARFMGFRLMINFVRPFFALNPQDFWRRWHISLSTWLRDYLFIPLGGSKISRLMTCRNLMITMVIGGLWHGANWTFLLWGAIHGAILFLFHSLKTIKSPLLGTTWGSKFVSVFLMFHFVVFTFSIFRADSMTSLLKLYDILFFKLRWDGFSNPVVYLFLIIGTLLFFVEAYEEIVQNKNQGVNLQPVIWRLNPVFRGTFYFVIICAMVVLGAKHGQDFVYFQF